MSSDDAERRYEQLLAELVREFPGFGLGYKQHSRLQRVLGRLYWLMTLGRRNDYLDEVVTTLGQTVYVPADWAERPPLERWLVLRHERVHLLQFRRYGVVPLVFGYLFLPLPVGLAWVRMRLEREAYEETVRCSAAVYGIEWVQAPEFRAHLVSVFCGSGYGWMWPFRRAIERWLDGVVTGIEREKRGG